VSTGAGAADGPYDQAYRRLLEAMRQGAIAPGTPHSEVELAQRAGLPLEQVRGAVLRLEYQGLVRRVAADSVAVVAVSPERWAEGGHALVAFIETAIRSTVPHLDDAEVDEYRVLVTTALESGRLRSDRFSADLLSTLQFWADHGRIGLLARFTSRALEQHRFGLDPLPTWDEWDGGGWLGSSLLAAETRDQDTAHQAGHLLQAVWARHLTTVAEGLAIPADRLLAPPADTSAAAAFVSSELDDETWWTVLGAVRNGTFAHGVVHDADDVSALTGRPERRARLAIRQLDVMGLVRQVPGGRASFTLATPTVDDWADTVELLVGLSESGLRLMLPVLDEGDVAAGRALAALVRRFGRSRDPRVTVALTDLSRFVVDRNPNAFLRDASLFALSRTFLLLEPAPAFRRWDLDVFLRRFEDALEHRDPDAASEAGHALARLADAHIADVRAERAVAEDAAAERAAAERARMDG